MRALPASRTSRTMKQLADVSVVIPTFNRAGTVCHAIESVLIQSCPPREIIVIDDGSRDGTEKIIAERFGDQVTFIWQENSGVAAARNRGIIAATTTFVAFLDSDDTWPVDKIEKQLPAMEKPGVVLSASNWCWAHEAGNDCFGALGLKPEEGTRVIDLPLTMLSAPKGHGILIQCCICRRDTLLELDGFDTTFRITEDNDLIFRMATQGRFAILQDTLLSRRREIGLTHLTDEKSISWRTENLDNMLRIFARSVKDAQTYEPHQRNIVRSRYARLLLDRAKLAAQVGDSAAARRYAFAGLCRAAVFSRAFLVGAAGTAFPRLLNV